MTKVTPEQDAGELLLQALSWIEPPFVTAETSADELRNRISCCLADAENFVIPLLIRPATPIADTAIDEGVSKIAEWRDKAEERLGELQKELDNAYPEIRKALGHNAMFAHTVNRGIVRVRGPLCQIKFAIEALSRPTPTAPTAGEVELREALKQTRLELYWCQKQLAAHGQTGAPGDSVSRALAAADAALQSKGQS